MNKDDKKAERKLKREAKIERRYGSPAMKKLAENDPNVQPYYERYKNEKRAGMTSLVFVSIFLLLGLVDILMTLITQKDSWSFTFAVDFLLALYWMNDYKISEQKADLLRHELVQFANHNAVVKTMKDLFKGKKDESDKAKKVD